MDRGIPLIHRELWEGSTYVIIFTLVIAKISDFISEVINSFLLFFTKYLHCYFPVLTSFI